MQTQTIFEVFLICLAIPSLTAGYPLSTGYPVYGTKRYNRPGTSGGGQSVLARTTGQSSFTPSPSGWHQPPSPIRYYPDQTTYSDFQDPQDDIASYYYYPDNRRNRPRYQQQYMYYPRYPVSDPVEDLEDTMRREEEGWFDENEEASLLRPMVTTDYYPNYYTKYNTRPRPQQQQQSYFPEDYYDNPYDWYRPQQMSPLQRNYLDETQHDTESRDQIKSTAGNKQHYDTKSLYDYLDSADDDDDAWINWGSKRSPSPKPKAGPQTATAAPPVAGAGQKEIAVPRPGIQPVRIPDFLLDEEDAFYQQKRAAAAPGVYDTIRKLIAMEKDLEQQNDKKAPLKKRFVASGEDFVQELNSLKKRRA